MARKMHIIGAIGWLLGIQYEQTHDFTQVTAIVLDYRVYEWILFFNLIKTEISPIVQYDICKLHKIIGLGAIGQHGT